MEPSKFDRFYMSVAHECSKLSYAERRKVGAVFVKDRNILAYGYNGTPAGMPNDCENKIFRSTDDEVGQSYPFFDDEYGEYRLVTKPEVIHAEKNAILKLASSSTSGKGSAVYLTLSPCLDCAQMMHSVGVEKVFYNEEYRDLTGVNFLRRQGIFTRLMTDDEWKFGYQG